MRLTCPLCGQRDRREVYYYGAEGYLHRPAPDACLAAWDRYLHLRKAPQASKICIQGVVLGFLLKLAAVLLLASPALAGGPCHWQSSVGVLDEDSRECRLSKVFEGWLAANGVRKVFADERVLTLWQTRSSLGGGLLPNSPNRPGVTVIIFYILSPLVGREMVALYKDQPGFFDSLDQMLATEGKAIVCETINAEEEKFIAAGDALSFEIQLSPGIFEIQLSPGIFQSDDPGWLSKVTFDQSSCEAP